MNDNSQTIVLIHYKADGADSWDHDTRNFDRVPEVGEFFTMAREEPWFEVKLVLHMAFPLDYDAEIWATQVDGKAVRAAL